ncbi:hypothetical protein KGF57_002411 [Candida theae]|uniref:Uncharacterized protein n=1 Tax=Candida theae TaxID=1198502 RepID=A0AAD5BFP6_9ASCO|nr:uncharacterized protein KGF57_002411 [Candida theae]KAI5958566.1 hypothetical protein KGF57_002411 [Candida theae]
MKDGSFSYLHLSNPNIATYIETWHNEPMPFDDVEPPQINNKLHNGNLRNGRELPLSLDNDDEDSLQGGHAFGAAGTVGVGGAGGAGAGVVGGGEGGGGRGLTGVGGSSGARGSSRSQWMDLQLHEVFRDDIKRFRDLTILPNIEQKDL